MTSKSVGFIGGGRIVRIFVEGWKRANALPAKIIVSDCNADSLAKLKARFPMVETAQGDSAAGASQDVVFLAVHPPVMAEVAAGIKGSLKPGATVVSLAPKFTFAKLPELLGGFARLAPRPCSTSPGRASTFRRCRGRSPRRSCRWRRRGGGRR